MLRHELRRLYDAAVAAVAAPSADAPRAALAAYLQKRGDPLGRLHCRATRPHAGAAQRRGRRGSRRRGGRGRARANAGVDERRRAARKGKRSSSTRRTTSPTPTSSIAWRRSASWCWARPAAGSARCSPIATSRSSCALDRLQCGEDRRRGSRAARRVSEARRAALPRHRPAGHHAGRRAHARSR